MCHRTLVFINKKQCSSKEKTGVIKCGANYACSWHCEHSGTNVHEAKYGACTGTNYMTAKVGAFVQYVTNMLQTIADNAVE